MGRMTTMIRMAPAVLAAGVVLLVVPAIARADDWSQTGHDAQRTNQSSSALDPMALQFRWNAGGSYHQPLIIGGDTVVARSPSSLAAFDLNTGAIKWQVPVGVGTIASAQGFIVYTGNQSLVIRDAATGALKYTVSLSGVSGDYVLGTDSATGRPVAYVSTEVGLLDAVRLDAAAGTHLWSVNAGGALSIAGDSLIAVSASRYQRINRSTGSVTPFKTGNLIGIIPNAAVDSMRNQFYINDTDGITGYSYNGAGGAITPLWTKAGAGIRNDSVMALDANGHLYSNDSNTLIELDPVTGMAVDSVTNPRFSILTGPLVSQNAVYSFVAYQSAFGPDLIAYDRGTLDPLRTIAGDHTVVGTTNNDFISVMADTHFLFDRSGGFQVYSVPAVPEPTGVMMLVIPASVGMLRRTRGRGGVLPHEAARPRHTSPA